MHWWGWIAWIMVGVGVWVQGKEVREGKPAGFPNPWLILIVGMLWWGAWQ